MKQIHITRDSNGVVHFETVAIDNTENVFFTNMDKEQPHKPSILKLTGTQQLGPYPSPNSSQVPVPVPQVTNPNPPPATKPQAPPYQVPYTCQVVGHENEKGMILVFAPLAAVANTSLTAIIGQFLKAPLVVGGQPPYVVNGLIVNNKSIPGTSTKPDQMLPIGSELMLNQNNQGIFVFGTPTLVETYFFTFTVNDSMGRNLQQVQYRLDAKLGGPATPSAP